MRSQSDELLAEINMTAIEAEHLTRCARYAARYCEEGLGDRVFFYSAVSTMLDLIEERIRRVNRLAVGDERLEERAAA